MAVHEQWRQFLVWSSGGVPDPVGEQRTTAISAVVDSDGDCSVQQQRLNSDSRDGAVLADETPLPPIGELTGGGE